jgi:hypothetical protein
MEQILERLLAGHEQTMAKMKAEMETNQEETMARLEAKMGFHHEIF